MKSLLLAWVSVSALSLIVAVSPCRAHAIRPGLVEKIVDNTTHDRNVVNVRLFVTETC